MRKHPLSLALLVLAGLLLSMVSISFAQKEYKEYNEAPVLAELVKAKELPPVEKRLPDDPFILKPVEKIGRYGGTARVFAINATDWNDLMPGLGTGDGLFGLALDGKSVEPKIASGYKFSDDLKTFYIYLRKGLKWSDGQPFTADDIVFWVQDVIHNDELTPAKPSDFSPGGKLMVAKKVDDYTVRIDFATPYPAFLAIMSTYRSWQTHMFGPKHYLKQWHIKYNPKANELAKKEGYETWAKAFSAHAQNFPTQMDLNLPRVTPWIIKESTTNRKIWVRNPYYWKVDTAGNQLPYIDRIYSEIVDSSVYQMKVISGEADFAMGNLSLDNYTLYKENEKKGDYKVLMVPGERGSEVGISLNLNEKDPVLRRIYQNVRFRQALSLAINRDEINEAIFHGLAVPRQATVVPACSFYKKEWGEAYAAYDVNRANQLLNEIGLTRRDREGFRLRPDGKPLLLVLEYVELEGPKTAVLEMVKHYWEKVGIKTVLKNQERTLFEVRVRSVEHGAMAWHIDRTTERLAYTMPIRFTPPGAESSYAYEWGRWLETGGKSGEEPPEDVKKLYQWIQEWQATPMGSKKYMEIAQKIFDFHARNIWIIGTIGMAPSPVVAKRYLKNVFVPEIGVGLQSYADQFYFEQ